MGISRPIKRDSATRGRLAMSIHTFMCHTLIVEMLLASIKPAVMSVPVLSSFTIFLPQMEKHQIPRRGSTMFKGLSSVGSCVQGSRRRERRQRPCSYSSKHVF